MSYWERRQMFQRRVLPTEEELWDAVMPAAFAAAWYSSLFRMLLNGTTNAANMAVFLLGGILPLSAAFVKGRTVLACRKKRRESRFRGEVLPGRHPARRIGDCPLHRPPWTHPLPEKVLSDH